MQPSPKIQPPNVSRYVNIPYTRSSHSWHDGCLPEGYPDFFSSSHLPPRLSSKQRESRCRKVVGSNLAATYRDLGQNLRLQLPVPIANYVRIKTVLEF